MVIRFEHQPYIGAMGALAYQTGAREAARKREQEERERQMQLLRMQQQQQQAAMDRSYGAWKTRYQHASGLQQAQYDHRWRDNNAERARDHDRHMGEIGADRKFFNDVEMIRLRGAEEDRRGMITHAQGLERQAKSFEGQGRNQEATALRGQISAAENLVFEGLNEGARDQYKSLTGKIMQLNTRQDMTEEEKAEKIGPLTQQRWDLILSPDNRHRGIMEPGGQVRGAVYDGYNNGDGPMWRLSPNATIQSWRAKENWEPREYDKGDSRYRTTSDIRIIDGRRQVYEGEERIGPSSSARQSRMDTVNRARSKFSSTGAGGFYEYVDQPGARATDPTTKVLRLSTMGTDAHHRYWPPEVEFDVNNPAHLSKLPHLAAEFENPRDWTESDEELGSAPKSTEQLKRESDIMWERHRREDPGAAQQRGAPIGAPVGARGAEEQPGAGPYYASRGARGREDLSASQFMNLGGRDVSDAKFQTVPEVATKLTLDRSEPGTRRHQIARQIEDRGGVATKEESMELTAGAQADIDAQAARNREAFRKKETPERQLQAEQRGEVPFGEDEYRGPSLDMSKFGGGKSYRPSIVNPKAIAGGGGIGLPTARVLHEVLGAGLESMAEIKNIPGAALRAVRKAAEQRPRVSGIVEGAKAVQETARQKVGGYYDTEQKRWVYPESAEERRKDLARREEAHVEPASPRDVVLRALNDGRGAQRVKSQLDSLEKRVKGIKTATEVRALKQGLAEVTKRSGKDSKAVKRAAAVLAAASRPMPSKTELEGELAILKTFVRESGLIEKPAWKSFMSVKAKTVAGKDKGAFGRWIQGMRRLQRDLERQEKSS